MASTTSPIQNNFKYDVFLSFRGEDTRMNFVGHLFKALKYKGIKTYKDDETIKKGEEISDQLIKSIEESRFYIIVFSKNYASSSWCLKELKEIMDCQKMTEHTAYPVFYDVEPTEVRNQSGAVEKAFAEHVEKKDAGIWRDALKEAADLAGWELKSTFNGDEAKFIELIVECISLEQRFISPSFDGNLVGMESRVNMIVSSFRDGFDDCFIGIKGIGGGGKTTLAKAVFDHVSHLFEGKSFVKDVRDVSKLSSSSTGLEKLQKQILKDVLNDKSIDETSVSDRVMKRMCTTKVILVLDDVDHIDQLKALAGSPDWFERGSKVIITTRDEQVLKAHRVHPDNIHDVDMLLLSDEEAICLFRRYAFGKQSPDQTYQDLSETFVRYAAGLPLTIKVLGSFLCGRNEGEWEDTIERLKTIPEEETLKRLEISYDGLACDQKDIFLDVACMLKGEMKDEAIRVLESCGLNAKIGLRVLEQKSLVTISNDGRLGLHDRIEEMGWNIVRRLHPNEPNRHSRLWIKKEIEDILLNDLGTESTRCIKLEDSFLHAAIIMKGLRKMNGLRFLYVNTPFDEVIDEVGQYLPNTLRSLHWPGYPLVCLPSTFQANMLVGLAMVRSSICQLWEGGEKKALHKLKFIDLKYSKLRTFDLGMTLDLEMLDLKKCDEFQELKMPNTHLKLKFLNLSGSKVSNPNLRLTPHLEKLILSIEEINNLIDSICMLKHLKYLKLKSCLHLEQIPTDICRLQCLEELHLMKCFVLKDIPKNICKLKHLKYLKVTSCSILEQLPEDLGILECLEELYLTECMWLRDIPNSICKLRCLKYLHLPHCTLVTKLPDELGDIHCLKELNIEGAGIFHLPPSIYKLKDLLIVWSEGRLEWHGFTSLKKISEYTASSYVRSCK